MKLSIICLLACLCCPINLFAVENKNNKIDFNEPIVLTRGQLIELKLADVQNIINAGHTIERYGMCEILLENERIIINLYPLQEQSREDIALIREAAEKEVAFLLRKEGNPDIPVDVKIKGKYANQ